MDSKWSYVFKEWYDTKFHRIEDKTRQELSNPLAYTTYTNWGHLARISYLIINKNETYVL